MSENVNMSLILISLNMLAVEYVIFFELYTMKFKPRLRRSFIFYNALMYSVLFVAVCGLKGYLSIIGICLVLFLLILLIDIKKGVPTYEESEDIQN